MIEVDVTENVFSFALHHYAVVFSKVLTSIILYLFPTKCVLLGLLMLIWIRFLAKRTLLLLLGLTK